MPRPPPGRAPEELLAALRAERPPRRRRPRCRRGNPSRAAASASRRAVGVAAAPCSCVADPRRPAPGAVAAVGRPDAPSWPSRADESDGGHRPAGGTTGGDVGRARRRIPLRPYGGAARPAAPAARQRHRSLGTPSSDVSRTAGAASPAEPRRGDRQRRSTDSAKVVKTGSLVPRGGRGRLRRHRRRASPPGRRARRLRGRVHDQPLRATRPSGTITVRVPADQLRRLPRRRSASSAR